MENIKDNLGDSALEGNYVCHKSILFICRTNHCIYLEYLCDFSLIATNYWAQSTGKCKRPLRGQKIRPIAEDT